jgi:uncharacterized membrane protein
MFAVIILLLLISIIKVNGSLFSSNDVYISTSNYTNFWKRDRICNSILVDPVMLYSNGSEFTLQNTFLRPQDFKSGIVPFENLTKPAVSGLEVVYVHDDI